MRRLPPNQLRNRNLVAKHAHKFNKNQSILIGFGGGEILNLTDVSISYAKQKLLDQI